MRSTLIRTSASAIAALGVLALVACQPADETTVARGDAATNAQGAPAARPESMPGQQSAQPATDNAALAEKVTAALQADAQLGALGIDVQVEQGVVTLSGNVTDPLQQHRAMLIARAVPGVTNVQPNFSS
jgi:osmotically-inducible protein OsmY